VFLEEKTKAKVETTENEIIVKGEVASKKRVLRTLLKNFLQPPKTNKRRDEVTKRFVSGEAITSSKEESLIH